MTSSDKQFKDYDVNSSSNVCTVLWSLCMLIQSTQNRILESEIISSMLLLFVNVQSGY